MAENYLHSARLSYRPMEVSDAESAYGQWMNTPELLAAMGTNPMPKSITAMREYLLHELTNPNIAFFAIRALNKEPIGCLKLTIDWIHRHAWMSLFIGNIADRGHGLGTEAIGYLSDYAFGTLNLHKLSAGILASNLISQRAFEKAGFKEENLRTAQCWVEHHWEDQIIMTRFAP